MTDATLSAAAVDPEAAARRRGIVTLVVHVLLIAASIVMLYPLFWMLSASVRPEAEIFSSPSIWPIRGQPRRLPPRLERAAGQLRHLLLELVRHRGPQRHRQRHLLLARGLCLRAAEVPGPQLLVRDHARHADDPLSRHADPAVRAVPEPRLGRHHPAARRAEVPRARRLLHLPDGAVLPRHPARARRGGDDGRLLALADLLEDHAAAVDAGAGDRRDLLVHLDLGRLLRAR